MCPLTPPERGNREFFRLRSLKDRCAEGSPGVLSCLHKSLPC